MLSSEAMIDKVQGGSVNAISSMRNILEAVPGRLAELSGDAVESKPAPLKWSAKEELGHLLDSAANNHQRIVRAQLDERPATPGYEQTRWVALHDYQHRDWNELIALWKALNRQLLAAAEAAHESAWSRTLIVSGSEPMSLQFVFEDYIAHMLHHLEHIGIAISDISSSTGKWTAA
jgi:hypothetical protein